MPAAPQAEEEEWIFTNPSSDDNVRQRRGRQTFELRIQFRGSGQKCQDSFVQQTFVGVICTRFASILFNFAICVSRSIFSRRFEKVHSHQTIRRDELSLYTICEFGNRALQSWTVTMCVWRDFESLALQQLRLQFFVSPRWKSSASCADMCGLMLISATACIL